MTAVERLLERLAELALVEVDTLVGGVPEGEVVALVSAYVADLEDGNLPPCPVLTT